MPGARESIEDTPSIAAWSRGGREVDELLHALADQRRRDVIEIVREETEMAARRCADRIEKRRSLDGCPDLSLVHVHLPLLADVDVITYDPDSGTIAPGQRFQTAVSVLDGLPADLQAELDRPD